jgi:hypothetical protein
MLSLSLPNLTLKYPLMRQGRVLRTNLKYYQTNPFLVCTKFPPSLSRTDTFVSTIWNSNWVRFSEIGRIEPISSSHRGAPINSSMCAQTNRWPVPSTAWQWLHSHCVRESSHRSREAYRSRLKSGNFKTVAKRTQLDHFMKTPQLSESPPLPSVCPGNRTGFVFLNRRSKLYPTQRVGPSHTQNSSGSVFRQLPGQPRLVDMITLFP